MTKDTGTALNVPAGSTQTSTLMEKDRLVLRPQYGVLVIEDDRHIARLISTNLSRAGLEARDTHTGADGLSSFHNYPPHLVLLDIVMPEMEGFRVYEKIRSRSSVPFIIMSARMEPIQQVRDLRCDMDDFILKPFDPQFLVARVVAHLRRIYRYDSHHIHHQDEFDKKARVTPQTLAGYSDSIDGGCENHTLFQTPLTSPAASSLTARSRSLKTLSSQID